MSGRWLAAVSRAALLACLFAVAVAASPLDAGSAARSGWTAWRGVVGGEAGGESDHGISSSSAEAEEESGLKQRLLLLVTLSILVMLSVFFERLQVPRCFFFFFFPRSSQIDLRNLVAVLSPPVPPNCLPFRSRAWWPVDLV